MVVIIPRDTPAETKATKTIKRLNLADLKIKIKTKIASRMYPTVNGEKHTQPVKPDILPARLLIFSK